MTITLFVEPKSLQSLVRVLTVIKDLDIDNDYVFTPSDLQFTEAMISNWVWLNVEVSEYLKLKYCIGKLEAKKQLQ